LKAEKNSRIQTKLHENQDQRKGSSDTHECDREAIFTRLELVLTRLIMRSFNAFHSYTLNSKKMEC